MSSAPIAWDRDGTAAGESLREAATQRCLLLVDDDEDTRGVLEVLLRAEGYAVSTASNGEAALVEAARALPDVVLTDLHMQPVNGIDLCRRLHQMQEELPVIVMTGASDSQSVIESFRAGARDYLIKPAKYDEVLGALERAVARRASRAERETLYRRLNERLVLSSIREQEHAEAEAMGRTAEAQQRAQINALLQNLTEGVVIADASGRLLMVNGAARAILGFGDQDLGTAGALSALQVHDLEGRPLSSEQLCLRRALRGEQFEDFEVLRTRPNGERRHIVSTATNVKDDSGNVALAIVVFRDITELRRLEQQRDEYLGLLSHDLRGPLNGLLVFISGMTRTMGQTGATVSLAERAERSVMRMKAMLDELTEATTLQSHGVALQHAACDLEKLVAGVLDGMDDETARRVRVETDDALSYGVLGDRSRLERVVANLLTNALKYSAADAPVTVRLSVTRSEVELNVSDQGIGIAPESVKMLFDRYYRTREGKERTSGLGLGLYIARLIVEAHGGRIQVSSEVGKGSTFSVILPSQAHRPEHASGPHP
jgi:PAS domain S-box-containing protein